MGHEVRTEELEPTKCKDQIRNALLNSDYVIMVLHGKEDGERNFIGLWIGSGQYLGSKDLAALLVEGCGTAMFQKGLGLEEMKNLHSFMYIGTTGRAKDYGSVKYPPPFSIIKALINNPSIELEWVLKKYPPHKSGGETYETEWRVFK
jgi:hypothetical protein